MQILIDTHLILSVYYTGVFNALTRPFLELWCYLEGTSCGSMFGVLAPGIELQLVNNGGLRCLKPPYTTVMHEFFSYLQPCCQKDMAVNC